jgi:hypothetical protein
LNENLFDEPSQHVPREWPRDWWIATKEVERATVAFLEEPQNIEEALTCENFEWSAQCKKNMILSSQTTHGLWYHFPLVGSSFLANGCSKSNKAQMGSVEDYDKT